MKKTSPVNLIVNAWIKPLLGLFCSLLLITTAQATTFPVSTKANDGAGSLRQAILDANADGSATAANPHLITFSVIGTITVVSPFLVVTNHVLIQGPGRDKLTLSGGNATRIFWLQNGTITIRDLTLANGLAKGGNGGGGGMGAGGAIFMHEGREGGSGSLAVQLINVTLLGNSAQGGNSLGTASYGGGGMGGNGIAGGGGVLGNGSRGGGSINDGSSSNSGGNGGIAIFGSGGNYSDNSPGSAGGFGGGGGTGASVGSGDFDQGYDGGAGGFGGGGGAGGTTGSEFKRGGKGASGGFGGGGGNGGVAGFTGNTGTSGNGDFGGGAGRGAFPGFGGGSGSANGGLNGGGGGMGAGGAIFVASGSLTMSGVTMTNNSATGGTVASPGAGLGGAIFLFNKADNGGNAAPGTTNDPTVATCGGLTFSGNRATYQNNQPGVNDNNQYGTISQLTPIAIQQQPVSGSSVCIGTTVTAGVSTSGAVGTYQWYQDGNPVTGQTSATLSLTNVQPQQAGSYQVVATTPCNSVTSTAFSLTVLSIAITQQPPAGLVATIGDNVQVPVGIRGVVTGYQWYKDGVLVSGQTSATLNLTNVQRAQAGNYALVAASTCNSVTTTALNLVVNAPPALVQGTKTVAGDFTPGGTITYTIILANSGAGDQPDAPDRELTDVLDAGLVLVSTSATSGQARAIDVSSMEWNGSIPAGGQVTITITATILADPTLIGQPIVNHPGFIYDSDGDGLNDRPRRTDDPTTAAPNDATVFVVAPFPAIRYVKPVASGTGSGSSWANASGDLQAMINTPGVAQVWVAQGTYTPTTTINRSSSFSMKNNVAIYGGFAGMETSLGGRPPINPVTGQPSGSVLSGDIGLAGDASDNSYQVIRNTGLNATAVLDGFLITGGNASGSAPNERGGGMLNNASSPTLTNLTFLANAATLGGALFNTNSSPVLTNCRFQNNRAGSFGGAIYNVGSRPSLTNCSLQANVAALGGAIAVLGNSQATLTNCALQSNTATTSGGVFFSDNSDLLLTNCSFQSNLSSVGSGNVLVAQNGGRRVLTNCVVYGNGVGTTFGAPVTATYCLFENTVTNYSGSNNRTTSVSPFVSTASVALNACAPAINAGSNDAYSAANGPATDLAGNPRIVGDVIDMGAVEFQATPNTRTAFTQLPASATGCVGSSLSIPFSVSGTGPFSVQLYRQGVAVGPAQSSTVLSFTNLQPADAGSYSVVVTGSCNSVTSTAFSVSVNALPIAGLTNNGPLSCTQTSVTLTASGGTSYTFASGSGVLGTPGPTNTVVVSSTGGYSVTVANAGGCVSTTSTSVTGDQTVPTISISPSSATLSCASPTVNLTAVGSGTVRWSTGETTPVISVSVAGSYSVTLTGFNGCVATASATITSTTVTLTVSSPQVTTALQGQLFSQTFTAQGGSDPYRFSALSSNLPTSLSLSPTGVLSGTPTQMGSFTIIVGATDQNGCTGTSASYRLMVNELRLPIRYVKPVASGTGDGSSWANASGDLQAMIIAPGVEQVWVAGGLYKPTTGANRTISFYMKEAVAIYGGFVGMETTLNQRPVINPVVEQPSSTTLSGDIGTPGDNSDNTYHVISNYGNFGVDLTSRTVLDGFVITGGGGAQGGGIFNVSSNPTITNCSLVGNAGNQGGGMYNSGCSPTLTTVMFENNVSTGEGGGLFNTSSNPILTNCRFQNNQSANYGGAIYNVGSRPSLTNCSLQANVARLGGAIAVLGNSQATLTNCSLQSNTATATGGVFFGDNSDLLLTNCSFQSNLSSVGSGNVLVAQNGGRRVFTNCVVYGNGVGIAFGAPVEASYCLFENTVTNYSGSNNRTTSVSPFVSASSVALNACAPAINAGSNEAYSAANGPTTDLAGNPRIVGDVIDMGAVEFQATPNTRTAFTQLPASATGCVGSSLSIPFSVSGTGPFSVQLYRQGVAVGPAQSSTVLSFTNLQPADAGSYSVVVTGSCNSVTSTAFNLTVTPQSPDYQPLVDLYNSTNGAGWTNKAGWLTGCTPCGWYGVSCDGNGRVRKVDLRNNNLRGTIPASLSALVALQELSLQDNVLSGNIPSALANLSNLTILNLGQNQLSGPVSASFAALTGLQVGYFNNNQLSGCFPASLSAVCGKLQFGGNPGLPGGGDFGAFCARGLGSDAFAPLATASPNPACVGNLVSLSVTAGTSYAWSGPGGFTATTQTPGFTATTANSGLYSVTVGNGSPTCSAITSVSLTVSSPATASLVSSGPLNCTNTTVTLTATGPTSDLNSIYRFSSGATQTGTGNTARVSSPGVYSVTVNSAGSCPAVASTTVVSDQSVPTASLTNNGPISCSMTSVTLTASGGSTYRFSSGANQVGNGPTATVSSAGIYSVTVVGANGCSAVVETTVGSNQTPPTASLSNNGPLSCSTTTVLLTAGGGGTYRFSSGATQVNGGNTATVNAAGIYSVTVVGTNGCSATASTTVVGDQSAPTAGLSNNGPISCSMTSVTLTASGGSTYHFSAGASQIGSGPTATVSSAGVYSVTVVSNNGCSSVASTTVVGDVSVPTAGLTNNGPISCLTTSVTLTASGGGTYRFSSGANQVGDGPTAMVSSAGIYSVTVVGSNGCSATASTTVTGNQSVPVASLINNGPISCSTINVTLTASGGGSYRFSAGANQVNGGNTATANSAGVYSVTVTSNNGCSSVASTTVAGDQNVPTANLTNNGPISCSMTSVTLTASGGSTYRFSSGASQIGSGPTATVSTAGVYSVTVVGANGCSATASTTVVGDQSVPLVSIQANPSLTITQGQSALLTASASGSQPLTYRWSTSQTTPAISVSTAGPYSVTVVSGNGCSATASVVSVTAVPVVSGPFAITGVSLVSCTPINEFRKVISIQPRYDGLDGSPVSFSVANELRATTDSGPYTLQLYVDNPTITLRAVQSGVLTSFAYNWLAACNSGVTPPPSVTNTAPTVVSPVADQTALAGQFYTLSVAGVFTDAETPNALTLSAANLPAGLSLTGTMISGTPSTTGTTTVTLTATDPGQLSTSTRFVLTITAPTSPTIGGSFAIVGVSTLSCTPIVAGRVGISFSPQYAGLNGSPVTFSVANELAPTTASGPYSLQIYVDNPTISLQALQSGVSSSFAYNWLAACQSGGTPTPGNTAPRVAQNVNPQSATVGQGYTLSIANVFTDTETPNSLVFTASGLPAGLSLSGTTITGTPSLSGTATVVLTATDPGSLSASASFVLVVSPAAAVTTSPPSAGFSLTGVQTLSCVTVGSGQRSVTFMPQYAGLTGQPITFSVLNELAATTASGPYTLRLYTDNPVIILKATQAGTAGVASFAYNWQSACGSGSRQGVVSDGDLQITVHGNPVTAEGVAVVVRGAQGQPLRLEVVNERGYPVSTVSRNSAAGEERVWVEVGPGAGLYLLQVSTPTQKQTIKLLKE